MHKLALVTPWPPQHTGIADYAYDLAVGLARQGVLISVFTDERAPTPAGPNIRLHHLSEFTGPHEFDRVIFQMGNNAAYHSSMIVPLGVYGGIVHLHDMVLHHLIHDLTSGRGQGQLYYRMLQHWYGPATLERLCAWNQTEDDHFRHSDGVTEVPLFDPVLRYAHGCIVHSEFCRQQIKRRFPKLPCEVIPQTYRDTAVVSKPPRQGLRIGAFGAVTSRTHADTLLMAAADAIAAGANMHVDIAGDLACMGKSLPALVGQLNLQQHVTLHGRVDHNAFQSLMRSVDLCVALRFPTMGETSGVVSRALQMGLPTIVNHIGWYAELPPFVSKLSIDPPILRQQLGQLLWRHATEPAFHQTARDDAERYAREVVDFEKVNQRYLAIANRFPQREEMGTGTFSPAK